jgi:hypothetical protein
MDNTRRYKRRHLFFYLQVTDDKTDKLLGYVVDISQRGLKIISEDVCEPDSSMELKMNLPDDAGQRKAIQFKAKCIWSGKDVNSEFYANGFELINLDDNTLSTIEAIINEYGFEELE